jgi:hypothetical protein
VPSAAFERLSARLRDIDDLMIAHDVVAVAGEPGKKRLPGLTRAAVVMLCAHLEGYVEDLFREAFTAIDPKLDPTTLVSRFHNPWPREIDALFATIGLPKASKGIRWESGATEEAVIAKLNSLVETRNRIAHGATDISVWKRKGVVSSRRYVIGFAQRLDEKVALHLLEMTGLLPWPPADSHADARPLRRRLYIDPRRGLTPEARAGRGSTEGSTTRRYPDTGRSPRASARKGSLRR